MQPCNRIYYSKVYWRLIMFRAAHRSSSGAPNSICSLWFIYPCGLTTAGHHMCIETRGCKYSLELLMMNGMPLETCWAFNKLWNNKFYYTVASCWLFPLIRVTSMLEVTRHHPSTHELLAQHVITKTPPSPPPQKYCDVFLPHWH
jgi:hypothetical protein